jgi:hypothetical protein
MTHTHLIEFMFTVTVIIIIFNLFKTIQSRKERVSVFNLIDIIND